MKNTLTILAAAIIFTGCSKEINVNPCVAPVVQSKQCLYGDTIRLDKDYNVSYKTISSETNLPIYIDTTNAVAGSQTTIINYAIEGQKLSFSGATAIPFIGSLLYTKTMISTIYVKCFNKNTVLITINN